MLNFSICQSLIFALLVTFVSTQSTTVVVAQASTVVVASTVTSYLTAPTVPPSPQYTNDLDFRTSILNSTNLYRYQHNATFLSWNTSLATYALNYASQCIWAHSHGPPGENLARGYPDVTSAVDAWGNERALYVYSPPSEVTGFTEATGHFTQLVWKDTLTVGCGAYNCSGMNGIGGWLLVCEYWPAGNIEGVGSNLNTWFLENVQSEIISGTQGFNEYSATVGATGGSAMATGTAATASAMGVTTRPGTDSLEIMWRVLSMVVGVLGMGSWL